MSKLEEMDECRHCHEPCEPAWGLCPACGTAGEAPASGGWTVVLRRAPQGSTGALADLLRASGLIPGRLLAARDHRAIARLPRVLVAGLDLFTARRVAERCGAQGLVVELGAARGRRRLRRVADRFLPALAHLPEWAEAPVLPEELVCRYRRALEQVQVLAVRQALRRLIEHVIILRTAARRAPPVMQVLLEGPRGLSLRVARHGIELAEAAQAAHDRRALVDLPGAPAATLAQVQAAAARRLQHLAFALERACAQVLAAGVTLPAQVEGELRQLAGEVEAAADAARELLSSN